MAIESVLGKFMIHIAAHMVAHRLERLWEWLQRYKDEVDIETILKAQG